VPTRFLAFPLAALSFALSVALLFLSAGCNGATGSLQGGQPLLCPPSNGGSTWTDLYADYFGPCGKASCSGQSYCHTDTASTGYLVSGFVCGATQESCFEGMTVAPPADAGGGTFTPIASGGTDPGTTQLVLALHKSPTQPDFDNMPCGGTVPDAGLPPCPPAQATASFSADDLARISAWLQQGAPNN
jgi:hypothetical protein